MLVEYFWHTKGLNYTEESFASLVEIWNGMIDGMSCEMNRANIITPREQNDDFDFLWMIAWPSQEARDACLDEWVNGNEPKWREAIDGIIDVDLNNAFLVSTEPAPVVTDSPKLIGAIKTVLAPILEFFPIFV